MFLNLQVRFVMGEGTTLGDLLELQLHRVEDEVKNIVDKAVKEMAIEKVRHQTNQLLCDISCSSGLLMDGIFNYLSTH